MVCTSQEEWRDNQKVPKSARRAVVETPAGMRNGYGKPRRLSVSARTITLRRPRPRGLSERFVSRAIFPCTSTSMV